MKCLCFDFTTAFFSMTILFIPLFITQSLSFNQGKLGCDWLLLSGQPIALELKTIIRLFLNVFLFLSVII